MSTLLGGDELSSTQTSLMIKRKSERLNVTQNSFNFSLEFFI